MSDAGRKVGIGWAGREEVDIGGRKGGLGWMMGSGVVPVGD